MISGFENILAALLPPLLKWLDISGLFALFWMDSSAGFCKSKIYFNIVHPASCRCYYTHRNGVGLIKETSL